MMRHEFAQAGKSTYPLSAPSRLAGIRERESEILEEVVAELKNVEPRTSDFGSS